MFRVCSLILLLLLSVATAQDVRLELGFRGEMVADRWNPIRLVRRDTGPVTLTIEMDQGSLREGVVPIIYQVNLKAARGLDVFEDDIYVPYWRTMVWKVTDDQQVLASGSLDRQALGVETIDLIISKTPETYLALLGSEHRIVPADDLLPKRLAAYDGVNTLIMDASLPMPSLSALSSAAAAGVQVFYIEDLPGTSSHQEFALLAPAPRQRLGAGWLLRTSKDGLKASLALMPRLDLVAMQKAIFVPQIAPRAFPVTTLLMVLGAYVLFVLLSIRLMGSAGLVTAFLLAILVSFAAWTYLRPPAQNISSQALFVNAGQLAQVQSMYQITQFPSQTLQLPFQARPASGRSYQQGEVLEFSLGRWQQETLQLKPRLSTATLLLEGNHLSNQSQGLMQDIYVRGLGQQPNLGPGQSLELGPGEESNLYPSLLPLLPHGTIIARQEQNIHIAIPTEVVVQP